MPEELHLVVQLSFILIAAGIFTIVSRVLKQPLILGYIVAGFLVGPKLGLLPQFSANDIHTWSELGIIFLLFSLGLEFSFKKLLKIGSSAFITATVNCIGMFILGILTGRFMGWDTMEGIFLGGMMSMSSTTIIIKAYDDMGLKKKPYASLIFGALVFEDLIAVLLMVLLSTLAVTGQFEGTQMLMGIVKLVFFLILWFLVGIFVIPSLLKKARNYMNDEILLLVSVGLCFLMVVLANMAGFSSALGAFVMGSILAETVESVHIEKLTSSIKDLFGAIFFVSVGMMVDPAIIVEYWQPILVITLITVGGILFFSTSGALLAGQGLNTAVHAGFTLAQLGEFSFIIAGLGCSLGVLREFIYPVIIAVSVITTFTTPYMIKLGTPAADFLQKHLPAKILDWIDPKQDKPVFTSRAEFSEWKVLLKSYFLRVVLYSVICLAIVIGSNMFMQDALNMLLPAASAPMVKFLNVAITIIVMIPFLYGIATTGKKVSKLCDDLVMRNERNRWPLLALILNKALIATLFIYYVIDHNYALSWWTLVLIAITIGSFIMLSRNSLHHFARLENTFLTNYNEKENEAIRKSPVAAAFSKEMAGYNVLIHSVNISADFEYVGKSLKDMPFRQESGVNIIKIMRGNRSITIPSGDEIIYPGDTLLAVGTPEQLDIFETSLQRYSTPSECTADVEFSVAPVTITAESHMLGRCLKESNIRKIGCTVVNVLHDGNMITNPSADYVFCEGDVVWIAGEKASIDFIKK